MRPELGTFRGFYDTIRLTKTHSYGAFRSHVPLPVGLIHISEQRRLRRRDPHRFRTTHLKFHDEILRELWQECFAFLGVTSPVPGPGSLRNVAAASLFGPWGPSATSLTRHQYHGEHMSLGQVDSIQLCDLTFVIFEAAVALFLAWVQPGLSG